MKAAYILVSHDRYFVNKTANKIWEIEDYTIKEFVGTYDEWESWKQERKTIENVSLKQKNSQPEKKADPIIKKKVENSTYNKELQKAQRNFQLLEEKIVSLNKEKIVFENDLSMPEIYLDRQKFADAEKKYLDKADQLKKANDEYEKLFEKIIELESKN